MPEDAKTPTSDVEPTRKAFSFARLVAICAVAVWCWLLYVAIFSVGAVTARTERVLAKTRFGHFEIRDATLPEAVEIYRQALKEAGISEKRVRVCVLNADQAAFSSAPTDGKRTEKRASVDLSNMPAIVGAEYVAHLFDLRLSVVGKEVRIHPTETRLVRRSIRINPGFDPDRFRQVGGGGPNPKNADGSYDMRELFMEWGIPFPEGAWAKMEPGSGEFEVFVTQEAVDLIDCTGLVVNQVTWTERITMWIRSWF